MSTFSIWFIGVQKKVTYYYVIQRLLYRICQKKTVACRRTDCAYWSLIGVGLLDSNINLRSKEDPISSVSQVLEGNFLHQGDNHQGSSNNLRCLSKWRIPIWAGEGHHLLVDSLGTSVPTHLARPDLRILLQSQLNNFLREQTKSQSLQEKLTQCLKTCGKRWKRLFQSPRWSAFQILRWH